MKKFFAMAILFASFSAQAETYCSISRENPKQKSTYDQNVIQPTDVLKGKTSASYVIQGKELVETPSYMDFAMLNKLNGRELVAFARSGSTVTISLARIDLSDLSEVIRAEAFAIGNGNFTALVSPRLHLSINCIER